MKPLTRFYFQPMTSDLPHDLVTFLQPNGFNSDRETVEFLIKNFVRCTPSEVDLLFSSEPLGPHLMTMMIKFTKITLKMDCKPGFQNCFVNFLRIFRDKLITILDLESSLKLFDILEILPNDVYQNQFVNLNQLIETLVKRVLNNSEQHLELIRRIEALPDCEGKRKLLNACH